MRPPFTITPKILELVAEISVLMGRFQGLREPAPQPQLRRQNRIRTIQGTLAVEGNTLNLDQVTAVFEKKRVSGPRKEILEVQNAIDLYGVMKDFDAYSLKDLLKGHGVLLKELAADAGRFRSGDVGILKGSKVQHVAPPAKRLPMLMADLFNFLKNDKETSPLIKACVFHYEFEFIHPFSDGNGRMGRFWQSLILTEFNAVFEYVPVESLIKLRQKNYYKALELSDRSGNSTIFIEFSLAIIRDAMDEFMNQLRPQTETPEVRLLKARNEFGSCDFSRKDYISFLKTISTATASRDLVLGVKSKILKRTGVKALTTYRFYLHTVNK